jgi:hypothetical protein
MARTYKIRKFQNGRSKSGEAYMNYSLTIPTEIAERLPPDIQYACTMDESGIHFTPVEGTTRPVETPSWALPRNGKAPAKPKRPSKPRAKPGVPAEA